MNCTEVILNSCYLRSPKFWWKATVFLIYFYIRMNRQFTECLLKDILVILNTYTSLNYEL